MTRRRVEVNLDELDQIIDRSTREPLSESEGQKLKTALHAMAEKLGRKRSTEKTRAVLPPNAAPAGKPEGGASAPAGHGRHSAAAFTGANRVSVGHATLHAGDRCPECREGKVYRQKEPATLIRFVGHAPLEATVFEMERLRCNACGEVFTADEPVAAGPEKYDETAVAMIALLKYGTGVPFQRLERLQEHLGMPLPATTQWDLMAAAAKPIRPALGELIRQAAQGSVMHNDDTGMRILRLAREPGDKRTGTFTSGIVSLVGAWTVALFFTGWKHAGENLAEVLKQRARELPAPIQMSDALSRNSPKVAGVEPLQANCLAHGRRQVVEVADNFPEECRYVLETLRDVYHHDALAREQFADCFSSLSATLARRRSPGCPPPTVTAPGALPAAGPVPCHSATTQIALSTGVSAPARTPARHRLRSGSRSLAGCGTQTGRQRRDRPGVSPDTTEPGNRCPSCHPLPRSLPGCASAV